MLMQLKLAMVREGVSLEDIADLLGIHRNSVYNKMYEKTALQFPEAVKIHEAFFPYYGIKELFKSDQSKVG